jgi:hypothetical protein
VPSSPRIGGSPGGDGEHHDAEVHPDECLACFRFDWWGPESQSTVADLTLRRVDLRKEVVDVGPFARKLARHAEESFTPDSYIHENSIMSSAAARDR